MFVRWKAVYEDTGGQGRATRREERVIVWESRILRRDASRQARPLDAPGQARLFFRLRLPSPLY